MGGTGSGGARDTSGRVARRIDALAAAALTDLGERGYIDAGTRVVVRGGTRQRRTHVAPMGVWYAPCADADQVHVETTWAADADGTMRERRVARDVVYHYAPTWARMPADTHRAPHRVRTRLGMRSTVALPQDMRDPDSPVVGFDAEGNPRYRAARGAIVARDNASRSMWNVLPGSTLPAVARTATRARVRALAAEGIGI